MPYARRSEGPVLGGDVVTEGEIRGFAYVPAQRPDAMSDRLLVAGDEGLAQPPNRAVPATAQSVRVYAQPPPLRLPADRVRNATEHNADLPGRMTRLLSLPGADWSAVATPLIEQLNQAGYIAWVAGGAVRDLVAGGACEDVNDLDLTGTAPPGRFTELARSVRRQHGLEYREKVSKDSLVCSAEPPRGGDRLFEYRTLNLSGFRFPASGSDMGEDARCRDFTVNSLYYDPQRHVLIDPTGRALADLTAKPRRLVSLHKTSDAGTQADIVLRAIKFVLRWDETVTVELGELRDWLEAIPNEWQERVDATAWPRMARNYHKSIGDATIERQRDAARSLGPVAADLLEELLRRAR